MYCSVVPSPRPEHLLAFYIRKSGLRLYYGIGGFYSCLVGVDARRRIGSVMNQLYYTENGLYYKL